MSRRLEFVEEAARGLYSMTELCARHAISRRVGYKWLARYEVDGVDGLVDQRRIVRSDPHRMPEDAAAHLPPRASDVGPAQAAGVPGAAAPAHGRIRRRSRRSN